MTPDPTPSAAARPAARTSGPYPSRKPRDDELDVFGLTHIGKLRKQNQDHYLLASIYKRVQILSTSLSSSEQLPFGDERIAYLAMVADGVGGSEGGERASSTALEIVMRYVATSMDCYYRADSGEADFIDSLEHAAMQAHAVVVDRAQREPNVSRMATTLTLWMGVWPWYYLLQVGDSRYYLFHEGRLRQISRDQTIAQDLIDDGVLARSSANRSSYANVLSSSIGGPQTAPVVTRMPSRWGLVHLLCSDGLTKHVSDERIAERLGAMTGSKAACEALLQDALDGGGTDNITVIVGRALPKD